MYTSDEKCALACTTAQLSMLPDFACACSFMQGVHLIHSTIGQNTPSKAYVMDIVRLSWPCCGDGGRDKVAGNST